MYQSMCMYMYIHICGMVTDAVLFSQSYQCEWNIKRWWEWTEKRGWTKEQESSSIKSLLKLVPQRHFSIPWADTAFCILIIKTILCLRWQVEIQLHHLAQRLDAESYSAVSTLPLHAIPVRQCQSNESRNNRTTRSNRKEWSQYYCNNFLQLLVWRDRRSCRVRIELRTRVYGMPTSFSWTFFRLSAMVVLLLS